MDKKTVETVENDIGSSRDGSRTGENYFIIFSLKINYMRERFNMAPYLNHLLYN